MHRAIALFTIELTNKSKIQVKAYDEIADKCYQKLKVDRIIAVEGKLNSKGEIETIRFFLSNVDSH